LLARREYAELELARKLRSRGFGDDDIEPVIAALKADGLLSDERFTEMLVRSRINRGQGPVRIRAELKERGVDEELAQSFLVEPASVWMSRAAAARRKRFGPDAPSDRTAWARQARFLLQRGFPTELVYRALARPDDADE
jgi:regulatory protein